MGSKYDKLFVVSFATPSTSSRNGFGFGVNGSYSDDVRRSWMLLTSTVFSHSESGRTMLGAGAPDGDRRPATSMLRVSARIWSMSPDTVGVDTDLELSFFELLVFELFFLELSDIAPGQWSQRVAYRA